MTTWGPDRHAGIEADMRRTGYQRIAGEARISRCVGHDHHVRLADGVVAECGASRDLLHGQSDPRLEPLPVFIEVGDGGHRRAEHAYRQMDDAIEGRLRRRVQDRLVPQVHQALPLGAIVQHMIRV